MVQAWNDIQRWGDGTSLASCTTFVVLSPKIESRGDAQDGASEWVPYSRATIGFLCITFQQIYSPQ